MTRRTKSPYSVHPGIELVQNWIRSLPEKTGRSLEQWLVLMKKEGPPTEKERREWLARVHGFGGNAAAWLAERAEERPDATRDEDPEAYLRLAERYVEDMFSGKKAHLRPIFDELLGIGRALGKDVRFSPCKTIVPFYRKHVIAEVKPASQKRVDFGLALGKLKVPKKSGLIDTGGAARKDRITHKLELASVDDIGAELKRWLKTAYELDA